MVRFMPPSGICKHHLPNARGDSGSRTRVQTRNQYAFYTLILASIFVRQQDPSHQLPAYLLNLHTRIAACACYSVNFRATWSIQPTDSAWSDVSGQHLVPTQSQPTILRFKQRELHCCCQLLFYRRYLRASLQCSACLHTYSTCCQNQLSPNHLLIYHSNLISVEQSASLYGSFGKRLKVKAAQRYKKNPIFANFAGSATPKMAFLPNADYKIAE